MDDHANKNNVALPMIDPEDDIIFAAADSVGASVDSVPSGISVGAEDSGAGASVGEGAGAAVVSEVSAEIQSRVQPAIKSVTFAEIVPATLLLTMMHLKNSSASFLHCGHRDVIGQRPSSTSSHDPISDSSGINASSSSLGMRVKQRFLIAQGRTISLSACVHASGT